MRYVQLRAFHFVAICGGFSRAAETLGLTQPAISEQVRKLEDEYDVRLLNRRKKQVGLTGAGQKLLEVTRRLFEVEGQALEFLSQSRDLRTGSLRIIADSAHHLLQMLGPFRTAYPGIEITISSGNSEDVVAALKAYEADVGVLGEMPDGDLFNAIKLSSAPLVAFTADNKVGIRNGKISLADLLNQPLILREAGSKTRQHLEQAAAQMGLTVKAAIEAEGREAVQQIVATGAGYGVVSAAEFTGMEHLTKVEISDCKIIMDEALICLAERQRGKLIRTFFAYAQS